MTTKTIQESCSYEFIQALGMLELIGTMIYSEELAPMRETIKEKYLSLGLKLESLPKPTISMLAEMTELGTQEAFESLEEINYRLGDVIRQSWK